MLIISIVFQRQVDCGESHTVRDFSLLYFRKIAESDFCEIENFKETDFHSSFNDDIAVIKEFSSFSSSIASNTKSSVLNLAFVH